MALLTLTGTLIVSGVIVGINVIGDLVVDATKDKVDQAKIQAEKQRLEAENKQLFYVLSHMQSVKDKLDEAVNKLTDAKRYLKDGGHVQDDIPLANDEFTSCIDKLETARNNAKNIIKDCNETIGNNNKKIRQLG